MLGRQLPQEGAHESRAGLGLGVLLPGLFHGVPVHPLVLDEARRNGAQLPVTALVDQFYAELQAMGGGRHDTSSLIRRLKR